MRAKRWRRWLGAVLLGLVLGCGGCKKDDKWGEDIEAPPADIDQLRREAREKKEREKYKRQGFRPVGPSFERWV